MIKRLFLTFLFLLFLPLQVWAGTYYARDGATGSWAGATNSSTPCSLDTANTNAVAGDIVCLQDDGGSFDNHTIRPVNSGSAGGGYITYENAPGDYPVIDATDPSGTYGTPIDLGSGQDYIKVKGVILTKPDTIADRIIELSGCSYVILEDITATLNNNRGGYDLYFFYNSDHVTMLNPDWKGDQTDAEQHDLVKIKECTQVFIYGGTLGEVNHAALRLEGTATNYIVLKDVTFTNKWKHGLVAGDGLANTPDHVLVDGCTFQHIGNDVNNNPFSPNRNSAALRAGGSNGLRIYRYNTIDSGDMALFLYEESADFSNIYIYHNTIYNAQDYGSDSYPYAGKLFFTCSDDSIARGHLKDSVILNNIFSEFTAAPTGADYIVEGRWAGGHNNPAYNNVIEKNIFYDSTHTTLMWGSCGAPNCLGTVAQLNSGNADGWVNNYAVNPNMTDPTNDDFTLASNSGAIDAGRFLATIQSVAGNVLTLNTNEANFFFSEETWGILDPNDDIQSDTIYDDDGNSAIITSIDYANDKITVSDATGFTATDTITTTNYIGSAPDIGANEAPVSDLPVVLLARWLWNNNGLDETANNRDWTSHNTPTYESVSPLEGTYSFDCEASDSPSRYFDQSSAFVNAYTQLTFIGRFKHEEELVEGEYPTLISQWKAADNERTFDIYLHDETGESTDDLFFSGWGYNNGESAVPGKSHDSDLIHGTEYWYMIHMDQTQNKIVLFLSDIAGNTIGSNKTHTNVIPAGETWYRGSANLMVGKIDAAVGFPFDGLMDDHRIYSGLMLEADWKNIITGGSDPTPTITGVTACNCTSPHTDLSGAHTYTTGDDLCVKVTGSEAIYREAIGDGWSDFKLLLTQDYPAGSLTLDYYAGAETATLIFRHTSLSAGVRETDPHTKVTGAITEGSGNLQDSEGYNFDLSGANNIDITYPTLACEKDANDPWKIPGDYDDYDAFIAAGMYEVPDDWLRVSTGNVTVQASGTSGHSVTWEITNPMTTFNCNSKNYGTIRGSNRIGTISNQGSGWSLVVIPFTASPAMMPGMGM